MANYSCKKFSPTTYSLTTIHSLQTGGQTDRHTDDNYANSSNVT